MKAASRNDRPVANTPMADNAVIAMLDLIQAHALLVRMKVVIPDVLDSQGRAITPGKYESKIKDGWDVSKFKSPSNSNSNNDNNPSRIYQLVLKSMKCLPYHSYTKAAMLYATQPSNKKRPNPTNNNNDGENDGVGDWCTAPLSITYNLDTMLSLVTDS
ncbi:hypothetical protein L210DRAFT_3503733 [Boletus edulis BED1]|uniref:Uncharacterized protein n=1 Tax=Boletus edulis BED1 TaxID=1328754 RepID=A0AAD4BUT7_BOLED|nr:hypothetical protein L210DRAFT_3503733 [Boletus edulis BED1]